MMLTYEALPFFLGAGIKKKSTVSSGNLNNFFTILRLNKSLFLKVRYLNVLLSMRKAISCSNLSLNLFFYLAHFK